MYAESEIVFPYLQNLSLDIQQLGDSCKSQKPDSPMNNLIPACSISEYDLGVEGDLFKAPEPIIEDQILAIDPMSAAMAMISCSDDIISPVVMADSESIRRDQELLDEVFYSCKRELMAKAVIEEESPNSEGLDKKMPIGLTDDNKTIQEDNKLALDALFQKGVSSGGLSFSDWESGRTILNPDCLDFPTMDFVSVYGMRRAFSEGDIKILSNGGNVNFFHSPLDRLIRNCASEDRREKLSRYRNKKTRRNFGRKIKYACRKALADNQPRIKGRFAKSYESDVSKRKQ